MEREKNISRMKELTARLDEAARAYYSESREIMSNFEYDALYDELAALEKETGTVLAGSPTVRVGYEVLSELPKERHPSRMLSLDKTKEVAVLQEWLGNHKGLLSWKMDGLTIVLTYENGSLAKAVTRGNGEIGEVVTPNARFFENLPLTIPYKGKLIVRGEAVIKYQDFEKINEELKKYSEKLASRKQIIVANKADILQSDENFEELKKTAEKKDFEIFKISAATKQGIDDLMEHVAEILKTLPKEELVEAQDKVVYELKDEIGFTVTKDGEDYVVAGPVIDKILGRVNMADNESLYYFQKCLREYGIEDELRKQDIQPGDTVKFGNWDFEWYEQKLKIVFSILLNGDRFVNLSPFAAFFAHCLYNNLFKKFQKTILFY